MSLQRRYQKQPEAQVPAMTPEPQTAAPVPAPAPTSNVDVLLQIAQTLAAVQAQAAQGTDMSQALDKLSQTMGEMSNRMRPENPSHSGVSVYSHPEGDFKRPKAPLKCEMTWVGIPCTLETLTPAEVDALNKLEPGDYMVTKGNNERIPFTVAAKRKQNGSLAELSIMFPAKGDQKNDHRSITDYCREAMGEIVPTMDALLAELARLKSELGAASELLEAR